jgi:hypothetical protein
MVIAGISDAKTLLTEFARLISKESNTEPCRFIESAEVFSRPAIVPCVPHPK